MGACNSGARALPLAVGALSEGALDERVACWLSTDACSGSERAVLSPGDMTSDVAPDLLSVAFVLWPDAARAVGLVDDGSFFTGLLAVSLTVLVAVFFAACVTDFSGAVFFAAAVGALRLEAVALLAWLSR